MSESTQEPARIPAGLLGDMVQLSTLEKEPKLVNPDRLYADAWAACKAAECKGNPEEILEAQQRLQGIRETYPGLE